MANLARLKNGLKKWPLVYRCLQRLYYNCLYIAETRVLGTKMHEWYWARQRELLPDELSRFAADPHRKFLVSEISRRAPFRNILEGGCNGGANLLLLAREFPHVAVYGIDINSKFIDTGRHWLEKQGVRNVTLSVGTVCDLSMFSDRSMDIVFTDATLMYVGPDKIGRAIREVLRVARQSVLLNEWNLDVTDSGRSTRSYWYDFHWVHNYRLLFQGHVSPDRIRISGQPQDLDLWAVGGWREHGALVEVDLG